MLYTTSELMKTMFLMFVLCLCFCFCCLVVDAGEVKSVSVMDGDSVTLHTDLTHIQRDDLILWRFGPQETLIARLNRAVSTVSTYDDVLDGMFRDRLQVDDQTGSLTITNITTQHSGLYKMIISSWQKISYKFSVTVYARLPVPLITRESLSSEDTSVSICSVSCSVMNVTHASLSWYKGKSLLSSISVSDLNISSISLHLECLDDSYTCVLNNPITNQTQPLNTDVCHKCSDCVCCCYVFETVIRLVLSALVGVATVAVLVYDLR